MNLAKAIEVMIESGCTKDQIAAMSRAYGKEDEERKNASRTLARVRQQKLRRAVASAREGANGGSNVIEFVQPVTLVTRDVRDEMGVLPEVSLNNNNKTLPNPSPKILPPSPSPRRASSRNPFQENMLDVSPIRLLADGWNEIAVETDHLKQILEIIPDLERVAKKSLPLIIRNGMDAPTAIKSFFAQVSRSDWLMGRRGTFTATFDWVVTPKNCDKILRGNYENRAEAKAQPKFQSGCGSYNGRERSGAGVGIHQARWSPVRD